MNIEKLNATITSSKVALSLTILTFDYKVAFSFSIGEIHFILALTHEIVDFANVVG